MKKRILSLMLMICLSATILSGCGSSSEIPEGEEESVVRDRTTDVIAAEKDKTSSKVASVVDWDNNGGTLVGKAAQQEAAKAAADQAAADKESSGIESDNLTAEDIKMMKPFDKGFMIRVDDLDVGNVSQYRSGKNTHIAVTSSDFSMDCFLVDGTGDIYYKESGKMDGNTYDESYLSVMTSGELPKVLIIDPSSFKEANCTGYEEYGEPDEEGEAVPSYLTYSLQDDAQLVGGNLTVYIDTSIPAVKYVKRGSHMYMVSQYDEIDVPTDDIYDEKNQEEIFRKIKNNFSKALNAEVPEEKDEISGIGENIPDSWTWDEETGSWLLLDGSHVNPGETGTPQTDPGLPSDSGTGEDTGDIAEPTPVPDDTGGGSTGDDVLDSIIGG